MHTGSCLCGAVSFEIDGELNPPSACHCSICRNSTGHYYAGTELASDQLNIKGEENVTWFQTSE